MIRKTLYGTLTQDEELNENEKAMLYIKECAELVGLEVIEGKTALNIQFMAEVMKRLREKQELVLDKIRAEIADNAKLCMNDTRAEGMYMALKTIDKYRKETEQCR